MSVIICYDRFRDPKLLGITIFRGSAGVGIFSPQIGFSGLQVRMNARKLAVVCAWGQDLEASRDVNERQRDAFGMVLGWLGNWRVRTGIEPGRESGSGSDGRGARVWPGGGGFLVLDEVELGGGEFEGIARGTVGIHGNGEFADRMPDQH